jgi:ATP-binding cassette subfamily F protein uup
MPLITLQNVDFSVGGPLLLEKAELSIEPGERIALIGRNGAGKSTLLKLLSGDHKPDDGEVRVQQGVRVTRLEQEVPHGAAGSVFDVVADGLGELGQWLAEFHHLSHAEVFDGEALGNVQAKIDAANGWGLDQRVSETLTKLDLDGEAEFGRLSGGMKRRVLLARALVSSPDVLLLDEPTNHLDIEAIDWLEAFLKGWSGSVVFVTHDRRFLRALATRIVEIDRGQVTSWPGDWANYERRREERLNAQAQENARFDKLLAQEEVWIRQGIKARRTRDEGRVRRLKAMRTERSQRRDLSGNVKMEAAQGVSSGKKVIDVKDISFAFGERTMVRDFTTTILRGDRIGLIGPNGSGKTTLLKLGANCSRPRARSMRHQPADRLFRPVPRGAARRLERDRERGRRPRFPRDQRQAQARACLPAGLPVHPGARACADHPPVRWRAQPPAAGQAVRAAVQPAGDGRTDQRPGRGNPGAAGRAAGRVHRHAAAGQPRP